jgi:3-hydroxyacyl-[acyl-carrier-protein] dehydratase
MSLTDPMVQALSALPHGPEFRFIDALVTLEPGVRASAWWQFRGTEEFARGHFPGSPLLPGVIMVEAMAQLGGIVAQTRTDAPTLSDVRLTSIRAVKILGSIVPGEKMLIRAELEGALGGTIQIRGEVCRETSEPLASGVIILAGRLPE